MVVVNNQGRIVQMNGAAANLLQTYCLLHDRCLSAPPLTLWQGVSIETIPVILPLNDLSWKDVMSYLSQHNTWEWEHEVVPSQGQEMMPPPIHIKWIIHGNPPPSEPRGLSCYVMNYAVLTAIVTEIQEIPQSMDLDDPPDVAMSQVMAVLSHEYRTPLMTILMSAELLQQYGHDWDRARRDKHYQRIQDAAHHLTGLVDRVMIIARANTGQMLANYSFLDLASFLQNIILTFQTSDPQWDNKIMLTFPEDLEPVWTDVHLLRHVVNNLLSNATKYSPNYTPIQLSIQVQSQHIKIIIQDHGIGIPLADQKNLFKLFHRACNVGKIPGIGLGLVIAHRCTTLLGGRLKFLSTIGTGSQFQIILPQPKPNHLLET